MQHGQAALTWARSTILHQGIQQGHTTYPCSRCMLHGHAASLAECPYCMFDAACSMDMQHGHGATTCSKHMQHGHAAWTCNMDMQHGHAACRTSMDMRDGHAARTGSMDMQHVHVHAANFCLSTNLAK
jgi:hypothetical protein